MLWRFVLLCLIFLYTGSCSILQHSSYKVPTIVWGHDVLYVKTKILVEYDLKNMKPAITEDEIRRDINFAERLFSPIRLKIDIQEIQFVTVSKPWDIYFSQDLDKKNSTMIVYYTFSRHSTDILQSYCGMATYPWDCDENGIVIHGPTENTLTLAHEIGHYFGLRHTFDECEYLTDTQDEFEYTSANNGVDYHLYDNIMNYSWVTNQATVSEQQIEEMKRWILTLRRGVIDWGKVSKSGVQ